MLQKETERIILKDNEVIFQKQDEFEVGQNPDGTIIGTYRSEDYRLFKLQLNPLAGGNVDLILTGSTKNKLHIVSLGSGLYELRSRDPKWPGLVAKYGDQIKGVSKKAWDNLQRDNYGPKLITEIRRITGL